MKNLKYAKKRIELLRSEMGEIKRVFKNEQALFIELENGMNLQLHDKEINYQSIEYLETEMIAYKKK